LSGVVSLVFFHNALSSDRLLLCFLQFRLGLFTDASAQPYSNITADVVCSEAHTALALSTAHQGIVLLKNNASTLPLAATAIRTLAVIGPNGACTDSTLTCHHTHCTPQCWHERTHASPPVVCVARHHTVVVLGHCPAHLVPHGLPLTALPLCCFCICASTFLLLAVVPQLRCPPQPRPRLRCRETTMEARPS
jgi:hypothetical protein